MSYLLCPLQHLSQFDVNVYIPQQISKPLIKPAQIIHTMPGVSAIHSVGQPRFTDPGQLTLGEVELTKGSFGGVSTMLRCLGQLCVVIVICAR